MQENLALLADFGSTFTKLVLLDLDAEEVRARIQTPSTVDVDITIGLQRGIDKISETLGFKPAYKYMLGTSSAAGGLKIVAIGLVPDLTVEAAKRAVLGAGAKVVGIYAYELTEKETLEMERAKPDLLMLAGGTDGGDRRHVIANAGILAKSGIQAPIVYAGNKTAADEVCRLLRDAGKEVVVAENVMPEIGVLKVEHVRDLVRELFIKRIVEAKGLKKAEQYIDSILMPTPTAVLHAAKLLAEGTPDEAGFGELLVIDIGGATTDVHSIAVGDPTDSAVIRKGLAEPFAKRTVEGDLGMRHNASTIVQAVGKDLFRKEFQHIINNPDQTVEKLVDRPEHLPDGKSEEALDVWLASAAARLAVERHAGRIETAFGPMGQFHVQYGKDLQQIKTVIGTGGPLIYGSSPEKVLQHTLYSKSKPFALLPKNPSFFIDDIYILYAVGIMSEINPTKALRIAKKYLRPINISH